MKTKISILIGLFCFIIGALTTCSSGDGEATLVLHLNGNSSVYPASSLQNWPPADNSELASLRYEINLSNSSGKRTETASGLGPIIFTLTPGYWAIEVTAYTNNELYAYGITEVSLSMGQNDVQVTLRRAGDYIILINVIPESISIGKGASRIFSAATFCASPADVIKHSTYVWSVSGNKSGLTSITQGGLLTVGSDETASTLTVKAESAIKDSIFGIAIVTVIPIPEPLVDAQTPVITAQPQDATFTINGAVTLNVTASVSDGGILSYQWFSNSSNSNTGGAPISGATNDSYDPPTGTAGIFYYYVVVTNTITDNGDGGQKTAPTPSNTVTVRSQYTITFNANGGTGTAPAPQTVAYGSAITLPNPTGLSRTGYNFGAWNTNTSGTGTDYSAASSYTPAGNTGNITLYAKWTAKPVTITLNANGGSGGTGSISGKVYGGTIGADLPSASPNIPTRNDYMFMGWSTNSGTTNTVNFTSTTQLNTTNGVTNADTSPTLTLYAVWNSSPSFTITFAQITDAAPNITGPTISRSGTGNPITATITVTNPGDYSSPGFAWYIDGSATAASTTSSITLDAANNSYNGVGTHYITLEVISSGILYCKTITFTVTN